MEKLIAYKFVNWDVKPLEVYKDTIPYIVKLKLLQRKRVTREEKDKIVSSMFYQNGIIKQGGWAFDFRGFMKTYLVKQYGMWHEYRAFDKTSLKKIIYGTIQCIVELK